jgi:hypothetical protein
MVAKQQVARRWPLTPPFTILSGFKYSHMDLSWTTHNFFHFFLY